MPRDAWSFCENMPTRLPISAWSKTAPERRKAFAVAVRKLKEQSPDLRPMEIGELQMAYEALRQGQRGKGR